LIVRDFLASNHQKPRIVTHRGFPLSSPGELNWRVGRA
jgi:hypothetical protein